MFNDYSVLNKNYKLQKKKKTFFFAKTWLKSIKKKSPWWWVHPSPDYYYLELLIRLLIVSGPNHNQRFFLLVALLNFRFRIYVYLNKIGSNEPLCHLIMRNLVKQIGFLLEPRSDIERAQNNWTEYYSDALELDRFVYCLMLHFILFTYRKIRQI